MCLCCDLRAPRSPYGCSGLCQHRHMFVQVGSASVDDRNNNPDGVSSSAGTCWRRQAMRWWQPSWAPRQRRATVSLQRSLMQDVRREKIYAVLKLPGVVASQVPAGRGGRCAGGNVHGHEAAARPAHQRQPHSRACLARGRRRGAPPCRGVQPKPSMQGRFCVPFMLLFLEGCSVSDGICGLGMLSHSDAM